MIFGDVKHMPCDVCGKIISLQYEDDDEYSYIQIYRRSASTNYPYRQNKLLCKECCEKYLSAIA